MNLICKCFSSARSTSENSRRTNNRTGIMSSLQIPGQTVATNKPRVQVALAPKHGLMDWIRTMNNTPNISGTNGKLLHVTEEDLAKHNKKNDCWMAISGNVYNMTPYLNYHPGGVDELMRAAGKDGTALFQETHSWVNYTSMLEKCLVGRLITKPTSKDKHLPARLRFDFRQLDDKTLTLFIYTTCMTLNKENIFVYIENSQNITVLVFIDEFIHTIAIELFHLITNNINVRLSTNNRGQIEIDLVKQIEEKWKTIGKFTSKHLSITPVQEFEPIYFKTTLIQRTPITHDTDWYTFSLPTNIFMIVPIGYHIRLKQIKDGVSIVKPYTIVNKLLTNEQNSSNERTIELLIKHYSDRVMTPMLQKLNIGDEIDMSSFEGNFDVTRIDSCQTVILIAAGTGITPMIRILNYLIQKIQEGKTKKIVLLFFNKTRNDILCQQELQTIADQYKIEIHFILSRPDVQWTDETGYVRGELLQRLLPSKSNQSDILICVCGPLPFSKLTIDLLKQLEYKDNHLHAFLA